MAAKLLPAAFHVAHAAHSLSLTAALCLAAAPLPSLQPAPPGRTAVSVAALLALLCSSPQLCWPPMLSDGVLSGACPALPRPAPSCPALGSPAHSTARLPSCLSSPCSLQGGGDVRLQGQACLPPSRRLPLLQVLQRQSVHLRPEAEVRPRSSAALAHLFLAPPCCWNVSNSLSNLAPPVGDGQMCPRPRLRLPAAATSLSRASLARPNSSRWVCCAPQSCFLLQRGWPAFKRGWRHKAARKQ